MLLVMLLLVVLGCAMLPTGVPTAGADTMLVVTLLLQLLSLLLEWPCVM
jgi:hypothetical protein